MKRISAAILVAGLSGLILAQGDKTEVTAMDQIKQPGIAQLQAQDPWARQAMLLPALSLTKLPIETRFHLEAPGINGDIVLSTAELPEPRTGVRGSLGYKRELEALVRSAAPKRAAQQSADDRFFEFFDRYTERLSGPPLRWNTTVER